MCILLQSAAGVRSPLRFLSEVMKCESTLRILMLYASFCFAKRMYNLGYIVFIVGRDVTNRFFSQAERA